MRKGVTLVELAIVIVIIGILFAGILAGQTLIQESKISSDISGMESYKTAVEAFRLKYNGLVADMKNVTSFLPSCVDFSVYVTCNGNGNGRWDATEGYMIFNQLGLAQLIPFTVSNSYSPILKSTGHNIFGATSDNNGAIIDSVNFFNFPAGHLSFYMLLPDIGPTIAEMTSNQKQISASVVHEIDQKLDDGNGATGIMRAMYSSSYSTPDDFCVDSNGNYKVTETDPLICNFVLKY